MPAWHSPWTERPREIHRPPIAARLAAPGGGLAAVLRVCRSGSRRLLLAVPHRSHRIPRNRRRSARPLRPRPALSGALRRLGRFRAPRRFRLLASLQQSRRTSAVDPRSRDSAVDRHRYPAGLADRPPPGHLERHCARHLVRQPFATTPVVPALHPRPFAGHRISNAGGRDRLFPGGRHGVPRMVFAQRAAAGLRCGLAPGASRCRAGPGHVADSGPPRPRQHG